MQIERIKISELKPYKLNAKEHPQTQIDKIKESIRQFGFNDPVAIDEAGGVIEGHGRLQAMKEMGEEYIDVIRLSHLTEEQKKAYILVHNKLTLETGFDAELLQMELNDITGIDMEGFGFELPDELEPPSAPDYKSATQEMKENILNLAVAQFAGVGKYDIPFILPTYKMPKVKEWIGFNYVMSDKNPEGKGVHFFIDDYQFERVWNNPKAYIDKLRQYAAVMAPDFSPYGDMPLATQIFNHYRKHWVARLWQDYGITVIPTIRSSTDPRSLEFYLDGEPSNGVVAISSMWVKESDKEIYTAAKAEWDAMVERLTPSKILVYGKAFPFMEGQNIERIEKFTEKRWNS